MPLRSILRRYHIPLDLEMLMFSYIKDTVHLHLVGLIALSISGMVLIENASNNTLAIRKR